MTDDPTLRRRRVEKHADIVYGPRSRAAHILPNSEATGDDNRSSTVLCGLWAWSRSAWRGLGSYREWERGRKMPLCKSCRRLAVEAGWMKEDDE